MTLCIVIRQEGRFMRTTGWKALLCICLLLPAAGFADDSIDKLYDYQSRWRLSHPVDAPTYTDDWPRARRPFDLAVDDGRSILRVTKIRSVSLLTLAGDERSKWFLGINEDGFVGIHFRGFTRNGAKRHFDVSSLFSSKKDAATDDIL